jgi:cytochrome c556
MKKKTSIKFATFLIALSFAALPALLAAGQNVNSHSHHDKSSHSGANPLIEEMIILDNVFREVVSAVSLGDGERVHKALHHMHGTMEKTHEGVHAGTVKIPKNAQRIDEFVKMDKEFHGNLEALAHAAHKNDQKEMLSLTKKLLDGCVNCHQTFRK